MVLIGLEMAYRVGVVKGYVTWNLGLLAAMTPVIPVAWPGGNYGNEVM